MGPGGVSLQEPSLAFVLYPKKEVLSLFPVTRDLPEYAALSFFSTVLYLHHLYTNSLNLLFSKAVFQDVDTLRIGRKTLHSYLRERTRCSVKMC